MKIKIKITRSENTSYYNVPSGSIIEEDFEKYVAAVVASEIGNAPLEACKAQAVVSRTYAYRYILKDKPIPDGNSAQAFRVQRYSDSYKICKQAAEETEREILTYEGSPIDAYFSSSNGGFTVSSASKWGGARDYLVSKPDPWDAATYVLKKGHGVGMSQNGAKYAARQNVKYENILEFYYPGTTLTKIEVKGVRALMITLNQFLEGCKENAARIHGYKLGCKGDNGYSDCIGYIIGSFDLAGQKWGGTHGSNYSARYRTKNLHRVTSASQLKLGELVYKARTPSDAKYNLPSKYKSSGDLKDYYHVGVVTSVNPLTISHCSTGGMNYDYKLGKWSYAGDCSLVDYSSRDYVDPDDSTPSGNPTGIMVVDVPDDTSVNVRNLASTSGKILTRIPEGTQVNVTSNFGTWSHVEYSYKKTGSGYVMSKYLNGDTVDVPDDTSVNVRRNPSLSADRITTVPEGTKVNVVSSKGGWTKIEYSYDQKGVGYIMSKYLKKG